MLRTKGIVARLFQCTLFVSLRERHCWSFGFHPMPHQWGKGTKFLKLPQLYLIMRCDIFRPVRISSLVLSVNRMYDHADTILVFEFNFFYTSLPTTLLSRGNFKHFCTLGSMFVENPWLNFVFSIFLSLLLNFAIWFYLHVSVTYLKTTHQKSWK